MTVDLNRNVVGWQNG